MELRARMRATNNGLSAVKLLFIFTVSLSLQGNIYANSPNEPRAKPNIILINLDDADAELFSDETLTERFPNLNKLAGRSVKFSNAHATTPLCGPSRACLLRAQYAHSCGIRVNEPNVPAAYGFDGGMRSYIDRGYASDDLGTWMQDAGYRTMQVGKFLHHQTVFMIPEGWDDFYSCVGGRYFETHRITNRGGSGPQVETLAPGVYRTNAETADSIDLIQQQVAAKDQKPFFLFLNPFGPHRQQVNSGEMFEARYADLWPDATMPESPAYDEADHTDLRGPLRNLPRLTPAAHAYMSVHYRERLLAMKSVDNMVGDIVDELEKQNIADNTYIIVTSDNGFALGHHRVISKGMAVDRATKVPLLVAGPGIIPGNSDHLLAHIDIGPTIVSLAGGTTPNFADGISFAHLIANPKSPVGIRDEVLIENFEVRSMFGAERELASVGLRLKDAIYVEWATGGREYFDLTRDPEQIRNTYNVVPIETRRSLASKLRTIKSWAPAEASFRKPYYDLDVLEYPFVIEGISNTTVATREVRLVVRDLSNRKFWDGENWVTQYSQVKADLGHPNGIVSSWKLPMEFAPGEKPAGLVRVWAWGLDWSSNFQAPDILTFSFGDVESSVTLKSPTFAQRFVSTAQLEGTAIAGDDIPLAEVQLRIRDVNSNKFWNGSSFDSRNFYLPANVGGGQWSYTSSLPAGTYRVSVNGLSEDGEIFDQTHRLFHVD